MVAAVLLIGGVAAFAIRMSRGTDEPAAILNPPRTLADVPEQAPGAVPARSPNPDAASVPAAPAQAPSPALGTAGLPAPPSQAPSSGFAGAPVPPGASPPKERPLPSAVAEAPWPTVGELRQLNGHTAPVACVAFTPDGTQALSAAGGSALIVYGKDDDFDIRPWAVNEGKLVRRFEGHTGFVTALAFAPDGLHFLSASRDATVRLWDVRTGREVRKLTGHEECVLAVAFVPGGRTGRFYWERSVCEGLGR